MLSYHEIPSLSFYSFIFSIPDFAQWTNGTTTTETSKIVEVDKGSGYAGLRLISDGDGTHNNTNFDISTYGSSGAMDVNFYLNNWSGNFKYQYNASGGKYDVISIGRGGGGSNGINDGYGILDVIKKNQAIGIRLNGEGTSYFLNNKLGVGTSAPTAKFEIQSTGTMGGKFDSNNAYLKVSDGATSMIFDSNEIYSNTALAFGASYSNNITFRNVNSSGYENLMLINSNGRVGIGTDNPTSLLSIRNVGGSDGVKLLDFSEVDNEEFIFKGNFLGSGGSGNKLTLGSNVSGWQSNIMSWRGDGNVGIGTSNPQSKVDINGGSTGDVILRLEADTDNAGSEADNPRIEMYQDNKLIYAHLGFNEDTPTTANIFQISTGSPDGFIRDALTINPYTGNVGMGTMDPTNKLEVNGTIRSQEVKVEASPWPDYVFSSNYDLRSLEETEAFIKENQHLPEIPSAQEIEAEGLALGEMNALLLKKIEELTLYIIEQEKRIEKLENK